MADQPGDDPVTILEQENQVLKRELAIARHMLGQYQQGLADHQSQLARLRAEQSLVNQPTA